MDFYNCHAAVAGDRPRRATRVLGRRVDSGKPADRCHERSRHGKDVTGENMYCGYTTINHPFGLEYIIFIIVLTTFLYIKVFKTQLMKF